MTLFCGPQNRDRFTHRYCMQWEVNLAKGSAAFSCGVSVTPRDALRALFDSRPDVVRDGALSGGAAVTLGGVGSMSDMAGLLRGCREWEGPKVPLSGWNLR